MRNNITNAKQEITGDPVTLCEVINRWFEKNFHNSPGVSDNPVIINHLLQAKDELIAELRSDAPVTNKEEKED